jgi:hypothetical protein
MSNGSSPTAFSLIDHFIKRSERTHASEVVGSSRNLILNGVPLAGGGSDDIYVQPREDGALSICYKKRRVFADRRGTLIAFRVSIY